MIEAGFEIELATLSNVGARAILASVSGVFFGAGPLTFLVARFGLHLGSKEALAVAACLTTSSSAGALTTLKSKNELNTPTGQLVVAAALCEDLFGLIFLAEIRVLARPSPTPLSYSIPVLVSLGFAAAVGASAVYATPAALNCLLPRVPERHVETLLLLLILGAAVGLVAACTASGASPLLGAFSAGLCFCTLSSIRQIWRQQVKRVQAWLVRLFFAASVGFAMPISLFRSPRVWRNAVILYFCTWGKLVAGLSAEPLLLPEACSLAFAMATLGEFSFILGTVAHTELRVLSLQNYASVTLAVLLTTIVSPTLLAWSLDWMARRANAAVEELRSRRQSGRLYYALDIKALSHWGLVGKVIGVLAAHSVTILDFRVSTSGPFSLYEAYLLDEKLHAPPSAAADPALAERMHELRSALLLALSHDSAACDECAAQHHKEAEAALGEPQEGTVDFNVLRGLHLRRWLPTPTEERPPGMDAAAALLPPGLPAAESVGATVVAASAEEGAGRPPMLLRRAGGEGGVMVAEHSGLDRAIAAMHAHAAAAAHRAAAEAMAAPPPPSEGEGEAAGPPSHPLRPLVVTYDATDAASVDRVVALAHAAAAREAAAVAARSSGLMGVVRRHHPPAGLAGGGEAEVAGRER